MDVWPPSATASPRGGVQVAQNRAVRIPATTDDGVPGVLGLTGEDPEARTPR